ncbi:MAG: APC family permease, partial [Candidatus Dormiibacterota bacterium]
GVVALSAPSGSTDHVESDTRLRRSLSFWQLFFIIVSGIIGSGWLFASLGASASAGPSAILSWVIASVLVVLVALTFAEMAGILPRTGAAVRYPHYTHGGFAGNIIGWCYLLWALTVPALEAEAVVTYASDYLPWLITKTAGENVLSWPYGIVMAIALMLVLAVINYFGALLVGRVSTYVTIWKLIIPCLTFIFLFLFSFHAKNFVSYGGFAPGGVKPIFSTIVASGITFSVISALQGIEYGGEARNPQRDLPWATVLAMLTAAVVYIALQASFIGAVDWHSMGIKPGDWSAVATSNWSSAPFAKALQASSVGFLGAFAVLLLIDAWVSPSATGLVYLGIGTRTVYGLSSIGYLPKLLQRLNRSRIPWLGLLIAFVVGCCLFAPFPSWYSLVSIASSTIAIVLVMGGIGLTVLRRTAPDLPRLYRLGAARLLAPAATMAAVVIIYWAGYATLTAVTAAALFALPAWSALYAPSRGWLNRGVGVALGVAFLVLWIATQVWGGWILAPKTMPLAAHPPFLLYAGAMVLEVALFTVGCWWFSAARGRTEVWRAAWLEFLILGVFVLSYYGAYGPLAKPPLGFPWGTISALVLGLVVFLWGVKAGFATEEIEVANARGTGVVEGAEEGTGATAAP